MKEQKDIREVNKLGLETYLQTYKFMNMEDSLKSTIKKLEIQLKKTRGKYSEELLNKPELSIQEKHYFVEEISSFQDKLLSVYEMIIVNDYKEFEIVLKRLLKASLDIEDKNFRSFKDAKTLLKNKGIKMGSVAHYNEIDDLRKLNNYIKHSISSENLEVLRHIPEFKKAKKITYVALKLFHQRINNLRIEFIQKLKWEIHSYLYDFDENKIRNTALRIVKRMGGKDIDLLIQELKILK